MILTHMYGGKNYFLPPTTLIRHNGPDSRVGLDTFCTVFTQLGSIALRQDCTEPCHYFVINSPSC